MEVSHDKESGHPRIGRIERVIDGADCCYTLQEFTRMRYLVVRPHGRGMLMVCRIILNYTTYEFAVFEADLQSSRWIQVNTLGGIEALFVSRLCSRAVVADHHWVRSDRIFFLDDSAGMKVSGLRDALANVYNMKDGRVSELQPVTLKRHGSSMDSWDRMVPPTWLFSEDLDTEE
jgi:hypothetical protein